MCGHFAQFHSWEEFLAALASDMPICSAADWHARYNIAPAHQCRCFIIMAASYSWQTPFGATTGHRAQMAKHQLCSAFWPYAGRCVQPADGGFRLATGLAGCGRRSQLPSLNYHGNRYTNGLSTALPWIDSGCHYQDANDAPLKEDRLLVPEVIPPAWKSFLSLMLFSSLWIGYLKRSEFAFFRIPDDKTHDISCKCNYS